MQHILLLLRILKKYWTVASCPGLPYAIGWIERKIKVQIIIFRVMVIFVLRSPQFSMNFCDNSRKKIGKFVFHSIQYIAHLSWKWEQNWGGGDCISLVGTGPTWCVWIEVHSKTTKVFCLNKSTQDYESLLFGSKYTTRQFIAKWNSDNYC